MRLLDCIPKPVQAAFYTVLVLGLFGLGHRSFVAAGAPSVAHARERVTTETVPAYAAWAAPTAFEPAAVVPGDADAVRTLVETSVTKRTATPLPGVPMVALTFDDGPWPGQTEQILQILAERGVPATFFMLGSQVERAPGLAQAVVQYGHAVGNHSYSHRRLDATTPDVVDWEIAWTTYRIETVTGAHPNWVRPPGGNFSPAVYDSIARAGARPVLWDIDPQDWRGELTPEEIEWAVLSTVKPGAVILLHDGGGDQWKTIAALPVIIDGLRASGYQFVTLDQLPAVRGGW